MVRYYGNYIHQALLSDQFPQSFHPLPHELLARSSQWTKRRLRLMKFRELSQPLDRTVFIKPARDKWFEAGIYHADSILHGSPAPDDSIYVQEPVTFTDEIRCFVLHGAIVACGHYILDNRKYGSMDEKEVRLMDDEALVDQELCRMAKEIAESFVGELPPGIVMDFGRRADGYWSLIEFNEAWCSGLYYSDPLAALDCIVASQH